MVLLWLPWEKYALASYWRRQWQLTPVLLSGKSHGRRSLVGCSPWGRWELDMTERLHFHFYDLEKEMATHSSVLACRIPGTGEPGGLPSMGSHRVGHDWSDLAAAAASYCLFNLDPTLRQVRWCSWPWADRLKSWRCIRLQLPVGLADLI